MSTFEYTQQTTRERNNNMQYKAVANDLCSRLNSEYRRIVFLVDISCTTRVRSCPTTYRYICKRREEVFSALGRVTQDFFHGRHVTNTFLLFHVAQRQTLSSFSMSLGDKHFRRTIHGTLFLMLSEYRHPQCHL